MQTLLTFRDLGKLQSVLGYDLPKLKVGNVRQLFAAYSAKTFFLCFYNKKFLIFG